MLVSVCRSLFTFIAILWVASIIGFLIAYKDISWNRNFHSDDSTSPIAVLPVDLQSPSIDTLKTLIRDDDDDLSVKTKQDADRILSLDLLQSVHAAKNTLDGAAAGTDSSAFGDQLDNQFYHIDTTTTYGRNLALLKMERSKELKMQRLLEEERDFVSSHPGALLEHHRKEEKILPKAGPKRPMLEKVPIPDLGDPEDPAKVQALVQANSNPNCHDIHIRKCPRWAAEDKCNTDPLMMYKECRRSCLACDPSLPFECVDSSIDCPGQASMGMCGNGPGSTQQHDLYVKNKGGIVRMMKNCPKSCLLCSNAPPPPPDADKDRVNPEKLVTLSRREPLTLFDVPADTCEKIRDKRHSPNYRLLERVEVDGEPTRGKPRIFCMVYTIAKNHATNAKAVRDTWGSRCDGFVVMSDTEDKELPAAKIEHEGPEEYNNIWQKVRSIWKYVHRNYGTQYEWFMIGGDDMYVIVENLRKYLRSEEITMASDYGRKPLFLGRRFQLKDGSIFNSGGAGYILNTASLKLLASKLDDASCQPHLKGFFEDVQVAKCLHKHGVDPYDTRDVKGRERFLPFTPGSHLSYRIPQKHDWYADYSIDLKEGFECCSDYAISFHYMKEPLMREAHAQLYFCPRGAPVGE